ncbi:hypothetical protein ACJRO7_001040, partial [Eucalyptus globulus]
MGGRGPVGCCHGAWRRGGGLPAMSWSRRKPTPVESGGPGDDGFQVWNLRFRVVDA